MQGRSSRAAPANAQVRSDSASVELLLPSEGEVTLELTFAHAGLAVLHDVAVRFRSDLTGPPHREDLFVILDCSGLCHYIMKDVIVYVQVCQVALLRNLSL